MRAPRAPGIAAPAAYKRAGGAPLSAFCARARGRSVVLCLPRRCLGRACFSGRHGALLRGVGVPLRGWPCSSQRPGLFCGRRRGPCAPALRGSCGNVFLQIRGVCAAQGGGEGRLGAKPDSCRSCTQACSIGSLFLCQCTSRYHGECFPGQFVITRVQGLVGCFWGSAAYRDRNANAESTKLSATASS